MSFLDLLGVGIVCSRRTGREVLVDSIVGMDDRDAFVATVSADGGKTWGRHRVDRIAAYAAAATLSPIGGAVFEHPLRVRA